MAPRPTLSFCITTRGPADRTRALLDLLRPHVDEIVLAVDRNGGLDTLDACADLADRRLVYDLRHSPAWLVGWVMHQCSCDWILRLDDDEVPSAALLDALPEIIADRYPTTIRLPRRWLYPGERSYLTSFPWSLEYQARLVRNVPSLWRFEGRVHSSGSWVGDLRLVEQSMYHLVLLTLDEEQRRAKRDRYEALVPALAVEDFRLGDMYLPEELPNVETAPVPPEDAPLIAALLEPAAAPPLGAGRAPVEEVSADEIAIHNTWRDTMPGAYDASITAVSPRSSFAGGMARYFELVVENRGTEVWGRPPEGQPPVFGLAWRWLDARSGRELWGEGRTAFPETVRPGQSTRMHLAVEPPPTPGLYLLELDVIHEHVRRFGATLTLPVEVKAAADAAVTEYQADGAEGLAAAQERLRRSVDEVEGFKRTRRYRFAAALATPLDRLRERAGRAGSGRR